MPIPNFAAEQLAAFAFTDEELARYDSDTPQPGRPGAWIIGVKSTDRDFAMWEEYRRRKAVDFMTDYDYDPNLEAEPTGAVEHTALPTAEDWADSLPNLIRTSEGYKGPCPRNALGACIADEDGWRVREGWDGRGRVGCRGCIDGGRDPDRKHFLEMLDLVFPERKARYLAEKDKQREAIDPRTSNHAKSSGTKSETSSETASTTAR